MRHRRPGSRGLTLVEILVAAAIFGVAAVGVFTAFRYASAATVASENRLRAVHLSTDLLEEIRTRALVDPDTTAPPAWGREPGEADADRSVLDDIDDYDALDEAPPRDPVGVPIDGLDGWSRHVDVETVDADDPAHAAPPGTTPLRRVHVTVKHTGTVLADLSVLAAGR